MRVGSKGRGVRLISDASFEFAWIGCLAVVIAAYESMTVVDSLTVEVLGMAVPAGARRFVTGRIGTVIAIIGVEAGVDVSAEACGAVEPWASTEEDASGEPFRSVVTIGGAVVGSGVIVSVRAYRCRPDVDADLGLGRTGSCGHKRKSGYSS
jgi:hypothetical protein